MVAVLTIGATAAMPQNFAALFVLGAIAGLLGAVLILPIPQSGVSEPEAAQGANRSPGVPVGEPLGNEVPDRAVKHLITRVCWCVST